MIHIPTEHGYGYLRQEAKLVELYPEIHFLPPAPLMPSTLMLISLCLIRFGRLTYSSSSKPAAHEEI